MAGSFCFMRGEIKLTNKLNNKLKLINTNAYTPCPLQVLRLVHPDKLRSCSLLDRLCAQRVFTILMTAKKRNSSKQRIIRMSMQR